MQDKYLKIITPHQSAVANKMHVPDPALMEVFITENEIKSRAQNTRDQPRSIIKNSQIGLSKEASAKMKRAAALRAFINRIRSDKPTYGTNPTSLKGISIPDTLRYTYSNELFLLADSGNDDDERIFIFATENNLKLLTGSSEWYVDGTFEVAPLLYKQMYNIAGEISGKILPLLYSLLPNKKETTYLKLFNLLSQFINPNNVTSDFEKACLNALLTIWPNVILFLCWFHFTQNLWKNMQLKKLVKDYA